MVSVGIKVNAHILESKEFIILAEVKKNEQNLQSKAWKVLANIE